MNFLKGFDFEFIRGLIIFSWSDVIFCGYWRLMKSETTSFFVWYADSTAVVFLHGLFSSSSFWFDTKIIPSLSDDIKSRHRVLAPDLLGCGRSPRPVDCAYTLSDHIECLEKSIFQRHGLKSVHFVAHSMGCIMALVLAARCPERVRSITLIAPVYPPGDFDESGKLAQLPCDAFFAFINPFTVQIQKFCFVECLNFM